MLMSNDQSNPSNDNQGRSALQKTLDQAKQFQADVERIQAESKALEDLRKILDYAAEEDETP